ncbi:MAG: CHASE domain-containing protein [Opitutales bacterium]
MPPDHMKLLRVNRILTALTLLGGLTLTGLGAHQAWLHYQTNDRFQFERRTEHLISDLQRRVNQPVYGLKSIRGLFAADESVSRRQFRDFIEARNLATEFPGIMGLCFVERVPRADLPRFVAQERADGAPEFTVKTRGDSPDLYLVKFAEPANPNRAALGFDLYSEPVRQAAVDRAVHTGEPTLSGRVALAYDKQKRPGFIFLLPIYRNSSNPVTPAEREAALVGLAEAPMVLDDVFAHLTAETDEMLDLEVYEGANPFPPGLLVDTDPRAAVGTMIENGEYTFGGRRFHQVVHLVVGGRPWTIVVTPSIRFEAGVEHRVPVLIGLAGAVTTVLLAGMVLTLGRSRSRALSLAQKMTADLRASEAEARRLAMVASRTNNAVVISDAAGRIEWANEGFTRLTGYTLDEVRGRKPGSFLQGPATDPATVASMRAGLRAGTGFNVEVVNYHKDGHPYWLAIEVQPLHDVDGRLTGYMAVESNISERKAAAERILASEQRLAALTSEVPGVIFQFEVSPSGQRSFAFMSAGYRELFGRDPAEAMRRPAILFGAVHAEDRRAVRRGLEQAIATSTAWIDSFRIVKPDGTVVWIDARSSAALRPDETKVWYGALNNITDLQQARVAADEARVRAEEASRAKSQFLAMMSHEIRTPMNGVIGMTSLLLDTPLTDQQKEFAEIVRSSGESLLTLINDILDFSKIESGRLELEDEVFGVRDCVESTLDLFAHKAAQKGIDLLYEIAEGVPAEVRGDITRLRQILVNLVSNALKFTEKGEIELTVRAGPADATTRELCLSVRDTGIGIALAAQDKLFQSFSQVDASTTRKYGGTGLGLAISKRLAELMGGRMWLESRPGAGSTFHFTVQLEWVPAGARRFVGTERPVLRDKRLLAVDDNATSRRILSTLADKWGMAAVVLETGREALARLAAGEKFDLGLLDMQMPEMDGLMLARAIRQQPDAAHLPLILLSSIGRHPTGEEARLFAAMLTKPAKPSQIFDAMAGAFGSKAPFLEPTATNATPADWERETQPDRILLAEDNSVNQKVALHMLARLGFRADAVANGLEVVQAVQARPYDIVLMDVQMPEMDGLAATRLIKQTLHPQRMPWIIALTANAMTGDREACLEAGMDDYLGKPIKSTELAAALHRAQWARRTPPDASELDI